MSDAGGSRTGECTGPSAIDGRAGGILMLNRLRGGGYKTRLLRPHDEFWDRRLGVRTVGLPVADDAPEDDPWRGYYTPTPYRLIFSALRRAALGPEDRFVDLGSGLGRAVFAARWMGARHAVGVELAEPLHAQAVRNLHGSRAGAAGIEFLRADARDDVHADTTVLYMAHPFKDTATMAAVMAAIERGLIRRPRALRIVYANPVHASAIDASACFRRCDAMRAGPRFGPRAGHWEVLFWQTV